ncbi:MAG: hypothetical protein ACK5LV_09465 [Lachnospirales bacterium]
MVTSTDNYLFAILSTLAVLFILVAYISIKSNKNLKNVNDNIKKLIDEEREANFARNKDIDDSYFVEAHLESLPILEDRVLDTKYNAVEKFLIKEAQHNVLKYGNMKMIKGNELLSNLEIKKQFGAKSLEVFALYEQNCAKYTKSLREISKIYIDLKDYSTAEQFLIECIRIGSISSDTYILLAQVYHETKKDEKILELQDYVTTTSHFRGNESGRQKILEYISSLSLR